MKNLDEPKFNNDPEKLPRYNFSESANLDMRSELKDQIIEHIDNQEVPLPPTNPEVMKKYLELSKELSEHIIEWLRTKLNVDVSDREMNFSRVYFYDEDDFKQIIDARIEKGEPMPEETVAFVDPNYNAIVFKVGENEHQMIQTIIHELMHKFSRAHFQITEDKERDIVTILSVGSGLQGKNKTFEFFNETIIETMCIESMADYYDKNYVEDYASGYDVAVITLDAMLKKISEDTSESIEELRRRLFIGVLKGDMSEIRIIKKALEREAERDLPRMIKALSLKPGSSSQEAVKASLKVFAQNNRHNYQGKPSMSRMVEFLGVDETGFVEKLSDYELTGEYTLSSGTKIKSS